MTPSTDDYDAMIHDYRTSQPDYLKLESLWTQAVDDRMRKFFRENYNDAAFSDEQLDVLVSVDRSSYRRAFDEEAFRVQLHSLHEASINTAVKQLEFERDNPDQADNAAVSNSPTISTENEEPNDDVGDVIEDFLETLVVWIVDRVGENFQGASRESGEMAKVVRTLVGISVADIEKYGILGGENSYLRKILPSWDNGERLLGGENSFFRKNLGLTW
ncbi:MAG: hypothetical protein WBO10_14855 [Pyrinomonadaceae bacterium]